MPASLRTAGCCFPAIAAAFRERRAYPALFGLGAAATVVFFLVFGFWPADRGEFYLPVLAVGGFFAARAADDWMCNGQSARPFMLAAVAYAALLLAASRMQESWLPALVFWVYAAASARWGWVQARGADGVSTTGSRLLPRFVLLGLTLALYLPPALGQLRPTAATLRLNLLRSVAPPGARLVTALSPHMAFAQTGHPAQAPLANAFLFDVHNTRKFLALWVEAARAGGAPIWMDEPSWKNRDKIFNFPGEQPIPWQDLAVVQYHADGEVFMNSRPPSLKASNKRSDRIADAQDRLEQRLDRIQPDRVRAVAACVVGLGVDFREEAVDAVGGRGAGQGSDEFAPAAAGAARRRDLHGVRGVENDRVAELAHDVERTETTTRLL